MRGMPRAWGAALALCAVLLLCFGCMPRSEVELLPDWATFEDREFEADLDGDGVLELVTLKDKLLVVEEPLLDERESGGANESAASRAQLPEGRYTSDAWVRDIDHDGMPEVVTLTWKRGSFGPYRPFWHTDEDDEMTQHLFVFSYVDGELRDKWLSSDVRMEIHAAQMDAAGRLTLTLTDGSQEICEWQDWGFAFLDEGNPSWNDALYDYASIVVAGDVIAHESILQQARQEDGSYCFDEAFTSIAPTVQGADLAIVNQEGPLVLDEELASGTFPQFGTPAAMAQAYKQAGFDVVALANNHMLDRGAAGVSQTAETLEREGLSHVGLRSESSRTSPYQPLVLMRNDISVGIVNATYGLNGAEASDGAEMVSLIEDGDGLVECVRQLSSQVDFALCYLHWGEEYEPEPVTGQETLASRLIDAGAQVIVGAHPHVTQRTEVVTTDSGNTGIVFFSLGNLVASQMEPDTAVGLLAQLVVRKEKGSDAKAVLADFAAIPTVSHITEDSAQVYLLEDYGDDLASEHWFSESEPDWLVHVRAQASF